MGAGASSAGWPVPQMLLGLEGPTSDSRSHWAGGRRGQRAFRLQWMPSCQARPPGFLAALGGEQRAHLSARAGWACCPCLQQSTGPQTWGG